MIRRWQIVSLMVLVRLALTSLALAKGDPYIEDPANEWGDLHNPTSVWSTTAVVEQFGRLDPSGDVDAFAFDFSDATQNWPVKLFVPLCGDHFRSVYPSLALIGPGLETAQAGVLSFALPDGVGAQVFSTMGDPLQRGVANNDTVEIPAYTPDTLSLNIPQAGHYILAVWEPKGNVGAYLLVTGSQFGLLAPRPKADMSAAIHQIASGSWMRQDCILPDPTLGGTHGGVVYGTYIPPAIVTDLTHPGGTSAMAVCSGARGDTEIYMADFAHKTITQLTDARGSSFDEDWSPDGTHLVFRTDRDAPAPSPAFDDEVYLVNADGSGQTNLTQNPANDGWPKWSPDGKRILFASTRDSSNTDIYAMDTDGKNVVRLTTSPSLDEDVTWSPDGKKIAFKSYRDGDWDIYSMNADGSEQTRLTNSPGEDSWPNWSPDGKHIVFETQRDSRDNTDLTTIYVMNTNGTNPTQVIAPASVSSAQWSPDGTEIAFYANGAQGEGIFMVNVASKEIVKLIGGNAGCPSWKPVTN